MIPKKVYKKTEKKAVTPWSGGCVKNPLIIFMACQKTLIYWWFVKGHPYIRGLSMDIFILVVCQGTTYIGIWSRSNRILVVCQGIPIYW